MSVASCRTAAERSWFDSALASLWAWVREGCGRGGRIEPLFLAAKKNAASGGDKGNPGPAAVPEPAPRPDRKKAAEDEGESCNLSDELRARVQEETAPGEEPEGGDAEEEQELGEEAEPGEEAAEAELAEIPEPRAASEWSSGSGQEDMELIDRFLQRHDDQAFIQLVRRYQHKVHNLCYRLLGDTHEAQDMSQEIFLTLHKSLKNFRGDSLFSTWVFRIATNHCKNRIKYLGRRKYYQSTSLDQPREAEDGDIFHEVEDEEPNAESQLSSDEIQAAVQEAISSLDEDHRLVIVLRDIEDLSYEEIAEIVGIKVGTVKSRIHRARIELKKKLEIKLGR